MTATIFATSGRYMNKAWEGSFATWAEGPGKTEQEKCDNAETAVRKAIAASRELESWDVTVVPHGSYRIRTNIKQDSDVDIFVRMNSPTFFDDYPPGKARADFGNIDGTVNYADYRNRIERALKGYLGEGAVTAGEKAFDVHENSYRIDADVIAVFAHRRYTGQFNPDGSHHYHEGIAFRTSSGTLVRSWPEQSYANGIAKNAATSRRYKRVIRVLKNLRNYMQEKKVSAATGIASFLIESLVWNVPNDAFGDGAYCDDVYNVLSFLIKQTASMDTCREWGEVNELFYLWHGGQAWTLAQAHSFLKAAWSFLDFS